MRINKAKVMNRINRGHSGKGSVYCIYNPFTKMYKIGGSVCVASRVKELEIANPDNYNIVAVLENVPNYLMAENVIQDMLAEKRMVARDGRKTEWYNLGESGEEIVVGLMRKVARVLGCGNIVARNCLAVDMIRVKGRAKGEKTIYSLKKKKEYVFDTWNEASVELNCSANHLMYCRRFDKIAFGEYVICS